MAEQDESKQPDGPFREYANNVVFQASVWDLTVIFGQLGLPAPGVEKLPVDWNTAVTIPWAQAKLGLFQLFLQVAVHEAENGPIRIHPNVLPERPDLSKVEAPAAVKDLQPQIDEVYARLFNSSANK